MTLDLKRIFANEGAVLPVSTELDMSDVDHGGFYPLKKPVVVTGKVSNRAGVVGLDLEMSYTYDGICDRCGCPVSKTYTVPFEKALAVSIEGEESDTILTVPEMQLDVDELVYTEVYVSLPTKFLCRKDCKGLCSTCGKNLNEGMCSCDHTEIDPRLKKLADLLTDIETSSK